MSKKVEAIKKAAVACGFGQLTDYTANSTAGVLKQIAVAMGCAASVDDVHANGTADVLNFIAENYGEEENEPFDLTVTATAATVSVKRGTKTVSAGADVLFNGDVLKITATPDEGKELVTLTVNGTEFESGKTFTVNGSNVVIVAEGQETPTD